MAHGNLLSKIIVNTLGSGDMRCSPPSVLLKVRNWKLLDLPVVRIIHVFLYPGSFPGWLYLDLSENVSYTCGCFTLRHLLNPMYSG